MDIGKNVWNVTASAYLHAGLSVIPTCADKRPSCAWKRYAERPMDERELEANFRFAQGIGIVCGKVSGGLELLDFDDGGSAFEPWLANVPPHLRERLVVERSPSGGRHVYYRLEGGGVPGNQKLAMKADGRVLVETRGEGGYVKCAPSAGYELVQGDFFHVPTASPLERQIMVDAAEKLDERGAAASAPPTARFLAPPPAARFPAPPPAVAPEAPWDWYGRNGNLNALLERHGWTNLGEHGGETHWRRPGKTERATSATWNGTVFYVFSSNAAPFEPNRGYNKFQAYATLEHGGDLRAATRAVRLEMAAGRASGGGEPRTPGGEPPDCGEMDDEAAKDPGPLPESLLHVPGFVDELAEHTLATAPYPNRTLAFTGALAMLSHLTGRNFRDARNLRTNLYLLALADSGVGKDFPRKVNVNLAAEVGIMPTMADRFASAEGLEDALLVHPSSFFQVDEVDTLFAALQEKKDSAIEKIYGALLQFATSSDTTYAMRKKAIQQTSGKACKFDKIRARGIREPHLTLFGCAIPKYLYSALSERALENGLLSRCLVFEAGARGKAGTPHFAPIPERVLATARGLVAHGGFDGLDLENLDDAPPPHVEPFTVGETMEATARREEVVASCEALYDAAKDTAAKALWARGVEKASKLAILHALSENPDAPVIDAPAVDWGWRVVEHLTKQMLYQASVYVHDNEFDALRQKALLQIRKCGGEMTHGHLLRNMHVDSDTMRRIVETLVQSELIAIVPLERVGIKYCLR